MIEHTEPSTASKKKPAKRTPMARFAKQIASGNHGDESMKLALPSGGLCVGDPITDSAPTIALGVPSCDVFLWSFEDANGDDDSVVIAVRVRKTVAVRWDDAPSGGVDSGIFAVWDESSPRDDSAALPEGTLCGVEKVQGRVVFAVSPGDGWFPCVAGYDEAGDLCALVAGPGVNPAKFGIAEPVDPAVAPVDTTTCPVAAPFRDALLEGASPADRAAIEGALAPFAAAFVAIDEKRKAKARLRKRGVLLLHWALACWSKLLAEVMPEQSRELAAITGPSVGKLEWTAPIAKILDYRMSDRRYDLKQALGEEAVATVLAGIDADRPRQLGIASLGAAWNRIDPKDEPLRDAIWYARNGMQSALELHAIYTQSQSLMALEPPLDALTRALSPK